MANEPSNSNASWRPILAIGLVVGMAIVSLSSMVLVFFAMLPTVVALIIDRTPQRYATFCVGGMNFCGTFPSLMELWRGDHTVAGAIDILTNVFSLFVMYGAASFGWMVYMGIPPVIGAFLTIFAQRRIQRLRSMQRELIAEWGEVLATSTGTELPDMEPVLQPEPVTST